jgi:hypothetical protein
LSRNSSSSSITHLHSHVHTCVLLAEIGQHWEEPALQGQQGPDVRASDKETRSRKLEDTAGPGWRWWPTQSCWDNCDPHRCLPGATLCLPQRHNPCSARGSGLYEGLGQQWSSWKFLEVGAGLQWGYTWEVPPEFSDPKVFHPAIIK